jgi:hypothetical protein
MSRRNTFINAKWLIALSVAVLAWSVITHLCFSFWGPASLFYTVGLALLGFAVILVELLLRLVHLKTRTFYDYLQLQAALGLYTTLQPKQPLFQLRTWGLGPDTAARYAYQIAMQRPEVIVELGSGTSTVISGRVLQKSGTGRVIALDDDQKWTKNSREMIELHGLSDVAEVRHAPLQDIEFQGRRKPYYDLTALDDIDRIDMLLVDGPHDKGDKLARLPGLYLLADRLSEHATVFVDDTVRPNWRLAALQWAKENGFSVTEPNQNEHGLLLLQR